MATTFTLKLPAADAPAIRAFLAEHDFEFAEAPHAFWTARGPEVIATFYQSGKLLLQGKEADTWRGLLGDVTADARPYHRALQQHPKPPPACWIGSDEAGKGDYFGPMVVAGVAVQRERLELLHALGIDDSKAIADARLPEMEQAILALGPTQVIVITPPRYNALHAQMGSVNRMLAWAHGKVIEGLLEATDADWVLIDRFAEEAVIRRGLGPLGREARVAMRPRAEEDPAVAAASILARCAYLRGLKSLSRRFGVHLHPGAGAPTLASGREFLARHGRAALDEVAKVHFATTEQIGG
ncbi:MAG: ribonuclease HIII [Myxococcales bacterium]|nr:ribonuclease HIII [Myxococcales bacterium]MCB9545066.1 ribonuclease HIII [Myxococcales bacterium]